MSGPLVAPPSDELLKNPQARLRAFTDNAMSPNVDDRQPVHRFYQSALLLHRQAQIYDEEGNVEIAFFFYTRFLSIWIEKVLKHRDYLKGLSTVEKRDGRLKMDEAFALADKLKPMVLEKYRDEAAARLLEIENERIAQEHERQRRVEPELSRLQTISSSYSAANNNLLLDGDINHLSRASPNYPGPVAGVGNSFEPATQNTSSRDIGAVAFSDPEPRILNVQLNAPSQMPATASGLPYKEKSYYMPIPVVPDRSTKPTCSETLRSESYSCNRYGFRNVYVPMDITEKFLNVALPNTLKNIETCGVICGTLTKNRLIVTHLLIPKQSGTSDNCTTSNEEELFSIQHAYDLLTLGWIHTHPTQTSFLSSIDLHTQFGYQIMLPEAVAIVCAPKHEETGVFMLTPVSGLDEIGRCRESGFHPHKSDAFEPADHVQWTDGSCELLDLR